MTLTEAIAMRQRQAALVGWRLTKRRQIEIARDGHATLTLSWSDGQPVDLRPVDPDDPPTIAGDHAITIDMTHIPRGVSVSVWTALPDTHDRIDPPDMAELRAAAQMTGSRHIDRGRRSDGVTIWYLVA